MRMFDILLHGDCALSYIMDFKNPVIIREKSPCVMRFSDRQIQGIDIHHLS